MSIICPSCGAENPDHATFCNLCCSSVGFESPEYTSSSKNEEAFDTRLPSSFKKGVDVEEESFTRLPPAEPVDVGEYGVRSGIILPEPPTEPVEATPVDVGQYGVRSGAPIHEMVREENAGPRERRRKRLFGRGKTR